MLLVSHLPEPEAICLLLEEALGWRTPEDLFVISLRALRVLSPPPGFFFWASTVPMLLPEAAAAVTTDSETANIKKKKTKVLFQSISINTTLKDMILKRKKDSYFCDEWEERSRQGRSSVDEECSCSLLGFQSVPHATKSLLISWNKWTLGIIKSNRIWFQKKNHIN